MVFSPRPAASQSKLPGVEVVAPHRQAIDDDLAAAVVLHHVGRRPVVRLGALRAPDLAAGRGIEHHQEAGVEVIEVQQQPAVVQRQRRALAERHVHAHPDAEVLLPEELAVHVVGVEPAGAEEREHARAVGDRRVRREAAVDAVVALVRRGNRRGPLPQGLARGPIDGEHVEAVLEPGVRASAGASRRLRRRPLAGRYRRRQEHPVAGDDRRRVAAPRDLDLPADVARAPRQRRVPHGHAGIEGAAPLRPIGTVRGCEAEQHGHSRARRQEMHRGRIP